MKFLVIYHAPQEVMANMMNANPEDMKKEQQAWMNWFQKCGDKVLDMGGPLANGKLFSKESMENTNNTIFCYNMMEADSEDQINELMKDHPHLSWQEGCSLEVYNVMGGPKKD